MVAWSSLANRKYDILAKQAAAGTMSAEAQMRNAATSAMLAPSSIAEAEAQAALRRAQAAELPLEGESTRALREAQAGLTQAQTVTERSPLTLPQLAAAFDLTRGTNLMDQLEKIGGMMSPVESQLMVRRGMRMGFAAGTARVPAKNEKNYKAGTAKVPGSGSGRVDTVPAKLAPGEAVLNKAAAETLGRGLIAALNAHGAQKMGLI